MSSPSNNKNSPSNDEEREVSLEPAASPSVPESDRRSVSPAKRGDDQSPPPRAAARGHDDRRESSPRSVGASPPRRYNTDDLDRNGRQQGSDRDRPLEPRDTARYSPRPADSDRDRPYRSEGGRFSGRGPPPRSREEGFSLFVKNVHPSVQAGELRELFERHGPVQDVYIPKDHYSRQPKGFAYVQLERFDDAQNAIAKLDRTLLAGQELSVEEAKGRRKSRDEMRSLDRRRSTSRGRYGGGGRAPQRERYDNDRFDRRREYSPRGRYGGPPRERREYSPRGRYGSPPLRAYSPPPPPRGGGGGRRYSPVPPYEDRGRRGYSPRYRRSPPPRDYPDAKRRRFNSPPRSPPRGDSPPPRR
mmetsp:Transcript_10630/g.39640  ORF Transcript_10630/g.39640 Transcript_10630/m.39640 type:complete len:359 (-) Transcript_10630:2151-3227(-)